jgi:hypothetical protein
MRLERKGSAAMNTADKLALGLLFAWPLVSFPAAAEDEARTRAMMDARQAALSVCIAYYTILKECSTRDDALLAQRLMEFTANSQAAVETLGMNTADASMRLELNSVMQREFIQGNCSRKGFLSSRFANQCAAVSK